MEEVDTFTIRHDDVVPSMNSPRSGYKSGHWSIGHKIKKQWQEDLSKHLMLANVPRNVYQYVEVSAVLTFPRAVRRDGDNYRMMLSKAFGDALVVGCWLPDDGPENFKFTDVVFAKGPKQTTLTVMAWRVKPNKEE